MSRLVNALWGSFARWLVADPYRVDWLIDRAMRTPFTHLGNYMERYWLIKPSRLLPISVRIHCIKRADLDRDPHNHPWNFRTIVLRGSYTEELLVTPRGTHTQIAGIGHTYARHVGQYHRIASVAKGGVWTLFIMGRENETGEWGYRLENGQHLDRRDYHGRWEGV